MGYAKGEDSHIQEAVLNLRARAARSAWDGRPILQRWIEDIPELPPMRSLGGGPCGLYPSMETALAEKFDLWAKEWRRFAKLELAEESAATCEVLRNVPAKSLEKQGKAIVNLMAIDDDVIWYGKHLIKFKKASKKPNSAAMFNRGDILGIFDHQKEYHLPITSSGEAIVSGVVHDCTDGEIVLSLGENQYQDFVTTKTPLSDHHFSLAITGCDVTSDRRGDLFEDIELHLRAPGNMSQALMFKVLMEDEAPPERSEAHEIVMTKIEPYLSQLNPSQRLAVRKSIADHPCYCIHGPPGTGKTMTIMAMIRSLVAMEYKVLATAPSNTAVDNMMEAIAVGGSLRMIRLGHPSRIQESLHSHSFEDRAAAQLSLDPVYTMLKAEVAGELKKLRELKKKPSLYAMSQKLRKRIGWLRYLIRCRQQEIGDKILEESDVVFSTCVSAANDVLVEFAKKRGKAPFDFVIIDEAGQVVELDCWIPILRGTRLIMAGDPSQLAPTVKSKANIERGRGVSLLSRVMKQFPQIVHMLTVQYRMHPLIMGWSNQAFYDGQMEAADCCHTRALPGDGKVLQWLDTQLIDGKEFHEDLKKRPTRAPFKKLNKRKILGGSKSNVGEALICLKYLEALCAMGVNTATGCQKSVGLISPYKDQVLTMKNLIDDNFTLTSLMKSQLKVSTVDCFQGQEKDIIIVSLVRSNSSGSIGFLEDSRRLNVAFTRAKSLLVVVGDSDTVCAESETLKSMLQYIGANGEIISPLKYVSVGEVRELRVARGQEEENAGDQGAKSQDAMRGKQGNKRAKHSGALNRKRRDVVLSEFIDSMQKLNIGWSRPRQCGDQTNKDMAPASEARKGSLVTSAFNPKMCKEPLTTGRQLQTHHSHEAKRLWQKISE
eukprot:Blabericola_migrator_1__12235@NODE_761_length_6625_cov_98_853614_g543_i0_p1_GENE_NODE_761_length_6625_cov_98_853614_g543_i0NODE_761_length_6625_cov_98_853614_g543_i0_p1_ORF_typecomplete_len884_score128_04AAA_12/PF13087_6/2e53AAA_11/PF13086_6/1e49AAA_30/PF13604_6/7_7e23Viral_helicase1/PF01443_18/10Viral_helicase1/PF01443_18/1_5e12AAA_19/PF13245_6/8_4e15ResIII/PF04851_15/5_1e11PIF1/PF05970_14/4_3e05PIF1/PF05970_14/1_8PhoH/PF02562_16/0_0012PhoH/PF02562_16/5_6UvrDhelicase/PF00580_21/3_8e05IstB_IS21/